MEDPDLREEFARDVVLLKYVGLNPIVVHGGGPEITAYMERLGLPVAVRGRSARVRRGHRRGRQDGARREGQQGDRAAPEPPRPAGRRPVRRRRLALPRRPPGGARRRGHRLRGPHRARERRRDRARRERLHPRDRLRRRRPRGTLLQRQRGRGRGRGGGRDRRLQDGVPHRRARMARAIQATRRA